MRKPDSRLYDSDYDDAIRAADADRDAAEARLRTHHLEGRLTDDEFTERLAQCQNARTMGELRALLVDLPGERPSSTEAHSGRYRPWSSFPLAAVLLATAFLFALFGRHSGWHHGWHHGYYGHHGFPWFPLLLVLTLLFALRGRWRCERAGGRV